MRSRTAALLPLILSVSLCSNKTTVTIPQSTQTSTAPPPPTYPDLSGINHARVQIDNEEEGPVFLVIPVNQKGVLECSSSAFRDKSLKWLKNDEVLSLSTEQSSTVEYEVDGSDTANAGLYTCLTNSESQKSIKVFVEERSDTVSETEHVTRQRGESFELSVPLDVYPVNLIEYKLIFTRAPDEGAVEVATYPEVDLSDQVTVSDSTNSLSFTLSESQPQHHGMYKFNLSYGDRTSEYQYFLTVSYKPEIVSFQRIPEFVSLNEDVIMTVNVSGYPAPTITWWHLPCCPQKPPIDIKELIMQDANELNYYHLLNKETLLNLKGGTRRFNGSYWFEAENELGKIKSPLSDYKLKGYNISVDSGADKGVTSLTQYENVGSLLLTCVVHASSPPPLVVWYHDNVAVVNTSTQTTDTEVRQILRVDAPGLDSAGRYNCVAQTETHTLWSFPVDVTVIRQPVITISPQVYRASVGATVIFSCLVDNIDGVRGEDWNVTYEVQDQESRVKEELLYLPGLQYEPTVRCAPAPSLHVQPVYHDGVVQHVARPPVTVAVITNKQRYTEGDTLIIRCVVTRHQVDTSSVDIFWKHGDVVIATAGGGGLLPDGRVTERYFTHNSENQTTEVLFIEDLTKTSAGSYTCVFNGGELGRYEDSYDISVHPATPVNTIAIIIAVCFVLIAVITMSVVLVLIVRRSKTFSYSLAEKQASPAMKKTTL